MSVYDIIYKEFTTRFRNSDFLIGQTHILELIAFSFFDRNQRRRKRKN